MKSLLSSWPLGLAIVLMGSAPAIAADQIGLSRDGVNWTSSLSGGLFESSMLWVPGDSESAVFHVRNQGPSSALLTIEARSADTDELLSNEDIRLRTRADAGPWVDLENGVPSEGLTQRAIQRGDTVRIELNATFEPSSPNRSQRKRLAPVFSVTLVDALEAGGRGGDRSDDAGGGGLMPDTGSPISVWVVVLAGGMLATGVRLARRRREVSCV